MNTQTESILLQTHVGCGCASQKDADVAFISAKWQFADYFGAVRCRIGSFRDRYSITPGLYALGNPTATSDVLVSANYKLSFDILRRSLEGLSAWILVLDTKGINVWCAAGKGTFGTDELVRRITQCGLERIVSHRRIIVPQLGATGVNAVEVAKRSGFHVLYGPVRANDLPEFIDNGYRATKGMRTVRFDFLDRLVLIPMEILPALKKALPVLLVILSLGGLCMEGILFRNAIEKGGPIAIILLTAIFSGAAITPLCLPVIPWRSFALKGAIAGFVITVIMTLLFPSIFSENMYRALFAFFSVPALSSYLALQFTGATTFTSQSGVEKEIKISMPIYIISLLIALCMLGVYFFTEWGIL